MMGSPKVLRLKVDVEGFGAVELVGQLVVYLNHERCAARCRYLSDLHVDLQLIRVERQAPNSGGLEHFDHLGVPIVDVLGVVCA